MEVNFSDFKVHENLLNLNVEKFKASIARLLPSRRPPTRSKLVKTPDENNKANDPYHGCLEPNIMDSRCPAETISTNESECENPPIDFAILSPQQAGAAVAAMPATDQSPSALASPLSNEPPSPKNISEETIVSADDNANSDSHRCNSKRWPFNRLIFKTPTKADDFPKAKSELENVLKRVLRSKGENLPSKGEISPSKDENLPSKGENLPSKGEYLPSIGENLPSDDENLPTKSENLLSKGENLPSESENLPSESENLPSKGENLPSRSENLPSKSENLPSKSENLPSKGENLPSKGENLPSKGENLPSKSQQNHSASEKDSRICPKVVETVYSKRPSFVTAESLKETKKRLRHLNLDRFPQNELDLNISSIGTSEVKPNNVTCADSQANKEYLSTAGATDTLTSECLLNSRVASGATDIPTSECGEWRDRRQSHEFELLSDLDLKKAILSNDEPVLETNLSNDSDIRPSTGLESSPSIRKPTAGHQIETRNQKTETLLPKGADIFELLRKFEKRVADEAATVPKSVTETSRLHTAGTGMRRRSKISIDFPTPAKVINDSWIRPSSPDPFQLDTTSTTSIGPRRTPFKTRAWDSVETPPVTRGRVLEALESLRLSSSGNDFEPHSQRLKRSSDSQEMDTLAKPQPAGDDKNVRSFSETYVTSQFCERFSSPQLSNQLQTTKFSTCKIEALPLVEVTALTSDVEKQKKVEFGKTEVHFSPVEPCKMKPMKIQEKPLRANLFRKQRSLSASPKMLGVCSGSVKFGSSEPREKTSVSQESKSRPIRRSSFNAPNLNYTPRTGDDPRSGAVMERKAGVQEASGLTPDDNRQMVTIPSMGSDSNNSRRAPSSISDGNESNATAAHSTEIDFEKESVTDCADAESRGQSAADTSPKSDDDEVEKPLPSPLRIAEEAVTVANSISADTKPKISRPTAFHEVRPEDAIAATQQFVAVLHNLNDTKKAGATSVPLITGAHDSNPSHGMPRSERRPGEELRLPDDRHCSRIGAEPQENRRVHRTPDAPSKSSKTDRRPVTIVHHGVRLPDKRSDGRRSAHPASSTPKSERVDSRSRKSAESKELYRMIGIGGGSLRKKMSVRTWAGREQLFDTGRDSWLNLPKECKSTGGATVERREPAKSARISQRSRTGDTASIDVDCEPTTRHHASRLPTPYSSKKSRKDDVVDSSKAEVTDLSRNARYEIASATYRDSNDKEDLSSHSKTHQKKSSVPPAVSKNPIVRPINHPDTNRGTPYAKIRSSTGADVTPTAKLSLVRNTSDSSLGSRSNSYEFKQPVLKTEQRSKQRAAHRAASREALMRREYVSSSEDIPWASDTRVSRAASKLKPSRKVTSTKASSQLSTRSRAPPKSKPTRNTKDGSISSRATRPMR